MDELTAKPQWIDDVEEAFSQIKNAGNAERAEWYEVIREDHGAIAERELKARVAAHDERVKPRPTPAPPSASAQVISLLNRSPRDFQAPVEAKPKPNVVARPTGGIRRLAGEKPQGISLPKPDQRIAPPEPEPAQGATEPEPRVMLPAVVPSTLPRPAPNWDEAIEAMNRQHAIIDNVGNKTVIASWEPTPLDPTRKAVVFQTKDSFLLRYSNRYAIIDVADGRGGGRQVSIPLGQWWLAHRQRQQYRGVTFMPNAAREINDCLNLWQGWGVDPKSGDWSLIQAHIEDIVAAGNEDYAEYVIRWLAWTIQNPDAPPEVALVLIGHKGAGKGTLARVMQRIFGAHAFQVTTQEHLIGKFNGHLQDCVVLIADEAYWEDTKKCIGRLQGMITEPTLAIERKGLDVFEVRNFLHVMMLAEPGWVIPAGRHERRYAVLGVSEARLEDKPYFRALHDQINNGGAEAMFYVLGPSC